MPNGTSPQDITPIGYHNFRGNSDQKFGVKVDDRRRHVYVVGKTGVGKSTLLENMAIADIQSGKGIAVIDPHGELAEKLLDFIPEERLDDVIYFNPSDLEHPIAFNPMEQVGTEFRHLVASGIMGVFKKIWVDAWSARMEYILNNTLLALLELPNSTLLGVLRMFAEPAYRKKIVDNLQDPVIKAFWQNEFARYSQKLETEALAAIQNKVGQFVSNPLIRNILGQSRSTINMREIMDTGKIFIVNLSKGKMGEDNSALLGAMIISRLQLAAMSRVDIPEDKRRDFYMYVDEFQNFATDSFASILSEARKYRLSITLAHQYIGQLVSNDGNTKVRDAVFGNVGTIISFRVGAADGEFLEKEFMPEFLQNDLVNLAKANIYIKLMIDGVSSKPFSATTVPPHPEPLVSYKDIIIKNSQQHYAVPRKLVEERIASEWQTPSDSAINDKLDRKNEKPLSEVLKPSARVVPQGGQPRPSSGITRVTTPGAGAPRSVKPAPPALVASAVAPTADKIKPVVNATPMDIATSAPARVIRPEPAKQFNRPKVDINELRRSINESLKKQTEGDASKGAAQDAKSE
jgi:energy-coupling factor transporter ATP-binding protein EcfA2